jgi:hypothetical protein
MKSSAAMQRNSSPSRPFLWCYGSVIVAVGLALFFGHIRFQPYLYLCGTVLSGLGIWLFYGQISFLFRTRKTFGTLVSWHEESNPTRRARMTDYYAELEFEAADGSKHQVRSATGSSSPTQRIGGRYPVRYDPENPDDARMDTLFDYWAAPALISLLGGIVICVAFVAK